MKNNYIKYVLGIVFLVILIVPTFLFLKEHFKSDYGDSLGGMVNIKYDNTNCSEFNVDTINKNYNFIVSGSAIKKDIGYEIVIINESNINDSDLTISFSTVDYQNEEELISSSLITELPQRNGLRILDNNSIQAGEVAFGKRYQLKVWSNGSIDSNSSLLLKVKINVLEK